MILLGILIGIFIGGCFGVCIMAVISVAHESREEADKADEAMWLVDPEESHYVCPVCHEYSLRDWAGAPTDSKYCPFCGTRLLKWDGQAIYDEQAE